MGRLGVDGVTGTQVSATMLRAVCLTLVMLLQAQLSHSIDFMELCRDVDAFSFHSNELQSFCKNIDKYLVGQYDEEHTVLPRGTSWQDRHHNLEKHMLRFGRESSEEVDDIFDNKLKRNSDDMYFGIRNRRSGDLRNLFNARNRRGGGYIRFGRSADSRPSLRDYLASFGKVDRRSEGGKYMRFGRSVESVHPQTALAATGAETPADTKEFLHFDKREDDGGDMEDNYEKKFMRFGRDPSETGEDDKRFMRFGKRFMRFGRGGTAEPNDDDKRFMRFGRDKEVMDEMKRFMRFGRDSTDEEKRFMRFGREPGSGNSRGGITFGDEDEKRFMRFGRDHFMRFGDEDRDEKRFMRFGKRDDSINEDKRFMRFGKKSETSNDDDKRFMRFGKKSGIDEAKRFMRFGKREDDEKRFMRFGKKGVSPVSPAEQIDGLADDIMDEAEKRFMRFGKKSSTSHEADSQEEKRFMRFGKKSSE